MSTRRRAGERARAADPGANPFVRSPLPADRGGKSALNLLHDAVGLARAAAELEHTYAKRAGLEQDVRGATSHDLLAQTHEAYATTLVAIARTLTEQESHR